VSLLKKEFQAKIVELSFRLGAAAALVSRRHIPKWYLATYLVLATM
jgi:hypothetical protein